jgi:hypothetical protein
VDEIGVRYLVEDILPERRTAVLARMLLVVGDGRNLRQAFHKAHLTASLFSWSVSIRLIGRILEIPWGAVI